MLTLIILGVVVLIITFSCRVKPLYLCIQGLTQEKVDCKLKNFLKDFVNCLKSS